MHQSAGLLLLITAGLMVVLHRSNAIRIGSPWIIAGLVLGFTFAFGLRDLIRRLGYRATEERILKDVRTYMNGSLQKAAVAPEQQRQAEPVERPLVQTVACPSDAFVPCRVAAFLEPKDAMLPSGSNTDLVVFDAMPPRHRIEPRLDLFAIPLPVMPAEANI